MIATGLGSVFNSKGRTTANGGGSDVAKIGRSPTLDWPMIVNAYEPRAARSVSFTSSRASVAPDSMDLPAAVTLAGNPEAESALGPWKPGTRVPVAVSVVVNPRTDSGGSNRPTS